MNSVLHIGKPLVSYLNVQLATFILVSSAFKNLDSPSCLASSSLYLHTSIPSPVLLRLNSPHVGLHPLTSVFFPGEPNAEKQSPEIRIVVAGKPGAGKSATGNTILGQETFEAGTLTRSCQLGIGDWKGRRVVVLDTPAVFDIYSEAPRMSPEMQRALRLSRPGPHALLLVLYLHDFSDADRNAVGWIQEVFGREALKRTIVVFTGKDDLHGKTVDHYLSQGCYRHILEECGGRSCVFSNKEKGESQAEELRSMVEKMVQENQGEPLSIPETAKHPEVLPKEKLSVTVPGEQRDALPGAAEEKLGLEATGGSIPGEENGLAQGKHSQRLQ